MKSAYSIGNGQLHTLSPSDQARTLDCMHDQQILLQGGAPPRKYRLRRITPLECCRLQGFPDDYEDGANGSDSARYRMWGNGMALPCVVDVLERIVQAANEPLST